MTPVQLAKSKNAEDGKLARELTTNNFLMSVR